MYSTQTLTQLNTEQQELRQTVQQDFLNIIGIAQDVQDALTYFKDNNKEIVKIQFNRLILQHNLSNGIHYDIHFNAKYKDFIQQEKYKVISMLNQKIKTFDPSIQKYLNLYLKNSLCQTPIVSFENPLRVETKGEFNQEVVSKLLGGMKQTDQTYQEIKNGKQVKQIKEPDVEIYLKNRSNENQQKLNKLYGQQKGTQLSKTNLSIESQRTMEDENNNKEYIKTVNEKMNEKEKEKNRSCFCCIIF